LNPTDSDRTVISHALKLVEAEQFSRSLAAHYKKPSRSWQLTHLMKLVNMYLTEETNERKLNQKQNGWRIFRTPRSVAAT
jgi:hypothetical protein